MTRTQLARDAVEQMRFRLHGATRRRRERADGPRDGRCRGRRAEDIARLAPDVLAGILPRVYPQMLAVVRSTRTPGAPAFIATRRLQQRRPSCSRRCWRWTARSARAGRSMRRRLHGPAGRALRLRRGQGAGGAASSRRARHRPRGSWAYSDSASDLPMLRGGRQPRGRQPRRAAGRGRAAGGLGGDALREARPAAADRRRHAVAAAVGGSGTWLAARRAGAPAGPRLPTRADSAAEAGPRLSAMAVEPDAIRRAHEWLKEVYARQPERDGAVHDDLRRGGQAALHRRRTCADTDAERDIGYPGRVSVHPRRLPVDVPRPAVDDAPVRRLRHRRGDQRALPLPARPRPDRASRRPSTCRP